MAGQCAASLGDKSSASAGDINQLADKIDHPRRLHGFRPCVEGSDFNDMVKSGALDRDLLLAYIRPMLPQRRQASAVPPFTTWCRAAKKHHDDPAVRAGADYVASDKTHPGARKPLRVWQKHWSRRGLSDHLMVCLLDTWNAYQADRDRILSALK